MSPRHREQPTERSLTFVSQEEEEEEELFFFFFFSFLSLTCTTVAAKMGRTNK
jgi:hypothetical protein